MNVITSKDYNLLNILYGDDGNYINPSDIKKATMYDLGLKLSFN